MMHSMDAPQRGAAPLPSTGYRRRPHWRWPRFSLPGTTGAVVFGCASFTPSLLPRDWGLQGAVAGITALFGYALGVFLAWLAREIFGRTPSAPVIRVLWMVVAVLGLVLIGLSLWFGQRWQHQIHILTGERPPTSYEWIRILLLTLAVFLTVVALARGLRWVVRRLTGPLTRVVPPRAASPLALLIVVVAVVGLNDGVVRGRLAEMTDSAFGAMNNATNKGTHRPLSPERSGSPASLVSWHSLGRAGRDFVGRGPSVRQLTAFSGVPAREPVRVYVGLESAATINQRAALAVRELRRTGAFDRAVLVVATTTGTGVVDPAAATSLEYMYNGDTAFVAMQYSFLPSWISFAGNGQVVEQAGRVLFAHVYDAWSALPPDHRPKLLVTGTSLGAYGSEAAFTGLSDVLRRTDGAVWAGSPNSSPLRQSLVKLRAPWSPERLPVFDHGRNVRFAASPRDLTRPPGPWHDPRVVYLQHGTDPVVFWNPRLAFSKPDWLSEPRAPDVSRSMVWIPIVTFWQVAADLPFAMDTPPSHGHDYRVIFVNAWADVAPPPGWTAEDTTRLRALMRNAPGWSTKGTFLPYSNG